MSLAPEEARAAAESYGWSVLPHDNGGFFAQRGQYGMIVTFNEDRSFRCASLREGFDGLERVLPDHFVVAELARFGVTP